MKIVAITQARTGSTRFPSKILKKVKGITLLEIHIKRILQSKKISQLIIATTINKEDSEIVTISKDLGLCYYQGSIDDVLDRFYQALEGKQCDYIVRLTSDCPLIDPDLIDKIIGYTLDNNLDYCSNTLNPKYPDGQDIEVFKFSALEKAWKEAKLPSEREHVTPYIWKNSTYKGGSLFKSDNFDEGYSFGHLRMTVDEPNDFEVIKNIINNKGSYSTWLEYAKFLENNLELQNINSSIVRNEGYNKSINNEK
jgi:spore coat polysaccharide biosynthesis protein SpsF